MAYPTTNHLINRDGQRQQIDEALRDIQSGKTHFIGLEYYGVAGLGKSRLLVEVKDHCRKCQQPYVVIDFLAGGQEESQALSIDFLFRLCEQLDHYFPRISEAHTVLASFARARLSSGEVETHSADAAAKEELKDVLAALRGRLFEVLAGTPLVIMFDSVEQCPDPLFNWIGDTFLLSLIHAIPTLTFLIGRGPRAKNEWPLTLRNEIQSFRLDPLSFSDTEKHLGELSAEAKTAANQIYEFSRGHPYSNEALAFWLSSLKIRVESVHVQRDRLAHRLEKEVIVRYILAEASPWALPLLKVAATPRRIDAGLLAKLAALHNPTLGTNQPLQWFLLRLEDLRERPLHLVSLSQGGGYEVEPTLRRLLQTIQAVLYPEETAEIHETVRSGREELLANQLGKSSAVDTLEVVYHAVQVAAIKGKDTGEAARVTLAHLLKTYFRVEHDSEIAIELRGRLQQDVELRDLLPKGTMAALQEQVSHFLQPPIAPSTPFHLAYLVISGTEPTGFNVSWFRSDQTVDTTEIVYSSRQFSADDWRTQPELIGRAAFSLYLPDRTQQFLQSQRDYAIQLSTNRVEIPWELLHDGQDFLCLSRPIARKPAMLKEPRQHRRPADAVAHALVVGDPTGDLPGAEAEALAVANLFERHGVTVDLLIGPAQATANAFSLKLITQWYDFIHYAGHAYFTPADPRASGLQFGDGPLLAEELERGLKSAPFIFLSACEAAQAATQTANFGFRGTFIESLATSALLGGAVGCLAPLWPIDDGIAQEFAVEFYRCLLDCEPAIPIGEAVRQARLAIRQQSADFWAAWVLYGGPKMMMELA